MNDETPRPELQREIATIGDGRDITRGFLGPLLIPTDRLLRNRGGNDLLIYEQVLSQPQVKYCFEQRRSAVTKCELSVDAASDRLADVQAADFIRKQISTIGFDRITDKMLYGVHYGYAVAEIIYGREGSLLTWDAIKVRNRRRFRFDKDAQLRLLTFENMIPGEPALKPYFWHYAVGADNDDEPYGLGLGHWCYWPSLFLRNDLKFWMVFLEKFGMPTVVGKYDQGATDTERMKLLAATQAIQSDSGIIIPKDMELALIEAARGGTPNYKVLHDTMEDTIAKVILGQTMTSTQGHSGGLAQAKVHHEVRQDIVKADADLICESFNMGPVRWICQFNFPNATPPRVYRVVDEPEDGNEVADRDTKVNALGFKPGLEYVKETYGQHWESGGAADTGASGDPTTAGSLDLADGDPAIAADRAKHQSDQAQIAIASAELAKRWHDFVEPRVRQLQTLLDETGDLQLFRDRLAEFVDADPSAEFVQALQRAGFAAQLLARTSK